MQNLPPEQLIVQELPGYQPEISRWIWALEAVRRVTLERIEGIAPEALDLAPQDLNAISTLLYHIAAIEVDWLYVEALEQEYPSEIEALFPYDVRDDTGRLTPVPGISLDEHLARLATVRRHLLEGFKGMTVEEFRRPRAFEAYNVTPEWVLYHLIEHEADHRGQISDRRTWAERELGINAPPA